MTASKSGEASNMSNILDSYPEYQTTARLDELRATEYKYLDEQDHVYLDYTGSGLAARAQHRAHEERLARTLFGNPHSGSPTSEPATELVDRTRARILQHVNASPRDYAVIFTANATGAARLVAEAYPFSRRSRLVLTSDNHNSVNGIREFARRAHARTAYVQTTAPELRIATPTLEAALGRRGGLFASCRNGLFAFPAQSNFSGVRHPLEWVSMAQKRGYDVLLDAAAYLPTGMLDLSVVRPEFLIVSWYKLFGYPTGVGCLIVRHDALARLKRPWFSGGTVQAVAVAVPWHALSKDETAFEDGTLNFLSIPDVHVGLDWLTDIGMPVIGTRVRCLTSWFLDRLKDLKHSNGRPMSLVYGPADTKMRGGTVSFNLIDAAGKIIDERLVAIESAAVRISLRTGCFCNPGGSENAFGLDTMTLRPLRGSKDMSLDEYLRVVGMPTGGSIRVSFGLATTTADIDHLFAFAKKTYQDRITGTDGLVPRDHC